MKIPKLLITLIGTAMLISCSQPTQTPSSSNTQVDDQTSQQDQQGEEEKKNKEFYLLYDNIYESKDNYSNRDPFKIPNWKIVNKIDPTMKITESIESMPSTVHILRDFYFTPNKDLYTLEFDGNYEKGIDLRQRKFQVKKYSYIAETETYNAEATESYNLDMVPEGPGYVTLAVNDENIFVGRQYPNEIQIINRDTKKITTQAVENNQPLAIEIANDGTLYIVFNDSSKTQVLMKIKNDGGYNTKPETLDLSKTLFLSDNDLTNDLTITDLQIQGNTLYALTSIRTQPNQSKIAGAILPIDISQEQMVAKELFGYKIVEDIGKTTQNDLPPIDVHNSTEYIMGPKKFIALEPKKLIIACEFTYKIIDSEKPNYDTTKGKDYNNIVTVTLQDGMKITNTINLEHIDLSQSGCGSSYIDFNFE